MIGYVTLGTNDLQRAAKFYDAIAAEMGVGRFMEMDSFIAWGKPGGGAGIGLHEHHALAAMKLPEGGRKLDQQFGHAHRTQRAVFENEEAAFGLIGAKGGVEPCSEIGDGPGAQHDLAIEHPRRRRRIREIAAPGREADVVAGIDRTGADAPRMGGAGLIGESGPVRGGGAMLEIWKGKRRRQAQPDCTRERLGKRRGPSDWRRSDWGRNDWGRRLRERGAGEACRQQQNKEARTHAKDKAAHLRREKGERAVLSGDFQGRAGMEKGRLLAFSDGVIAIIITIMVLELRPPHQDTLEGLRAVAPIFMSYVLSFVYIAIYWNNHHHMLYTVERVNGAILWANMHLPKYHQQLFMHKRT